MVNGGFILQVTFHNMGWTNLHNIGQQWGDIFSIMSLYGDGLKTPAWPSPLPDLPGFCGPNRPCYHRGLGTCLTMLNFNIHAFEDSERLFFAWSIFRFDSFLLESVLKYLVKMHRGELVFVPRNPPSLKSTQQWANQWVQRVEKPFGITRGSQHWHHDSSYTNLHICTW